MVAAKDKDRLGGSMDLIRSELNSTICDCYSAPAPLQGTQPKVGLDTMGMSVAKWRSAAERLTNESRINQALCKHFVSWKAPTPLVAAAVCG